MSRGIERAKELVRKLGMEPHVEGGYFVEVYKSPVMVTANGRERRAVTAIYYLLVNDHIDNDGGGGMGNPRDNSRSRLHRVMSDELWFHCEGDPLELLWVDKEERIRKVVLGGDCCFAVVPACCWQAARTLGDYTLVSCVVAPGFTYDDFELYEEDILKYPELRDFV